MIMGKPRRVPRLLLVDDAAALALGAHDQPLVDELVGDAHRLVEEPARVVAQVEDEAS
jgi:hypothetical protein